MAIFNNYVCLPEGTSFLWAFLGFLGANEMASPVWILRDHEWLVGWNMTGL